MQRPGHPWKKPWLGKTGRVRTLVRAPLPVRVRAPWEQVRDAYVAVADKAIDGLLADGRRDEGLVVALGAARRSLAARGREWWEGLVEEPRDVWELLREFVDVEAGLARAKT